MRTLAGCLALVWLLGAGAAPARAEAMGWVGAVRFELLGLPPLELPGRGVALVNEGSGGVALRTLTFAGARGGSAAVPITDPEATVSGFVSLRMRATVGSGVLGFDPWPAPGQPLLSASRVPVAGLARVCLFVPGCTGDSIDLALTASSGARGVGVGGQLTAGGSGLIRISLELAPWTLGEASLPLTLSSGPVTFFTSGWVHGPFSFTGSTAFTGGALSLVTPLRATSSGGGPALSGFARLEVKFVPEPRRLLLLTSGVLGLAWIGRGRMRR